LYIVYIFLRDLGECVEWLAIATAHGVNNTLWGCRNATLHWKSTYRFIW